MAKFCRVDRDETGSPVSEGREGCRMSPQTPQYTMLPGLMLQNMEYISTPRSAVA